MHERLKETEDVRLQEMDRSGIERDIVSLAAPCIQDEVDRARAVKRAAEATEYLRDIFYVTTSGNFHTASLIGVILQLGADRVLFAVDYPFEQTRDAVEWFDTLPISEADKEKIGRTNAARLFGV